MIFAVLLAATGICFGAPVPKPKDRDFRAEAALARAAEDQGRWDDAVAFYQKARAKAPGNYALCMKLAQVYLQMGRLDLAEKTFAEAKRLDPRQADAYIREGYTRLRAGERAQARQEFQAAIALDTSSPYGYHHMASYFAEHGDWAAAESYSRKTLALLDTAPTGPTHLYDELHTTQKLTTILEKEGRLPEAEALALKMLPESVAYPAWHTAFLETLADVYTEEGQLEKAEPLLRQAAAVCKPARACDHPSLYLKADALIHLAAFHAEEGLRPQALQELDEARAQFPTYNRIKTEDANTIVAGGEAYFQLGEDAKAEEIFRSVLSQRGRMRQGGPLARADIHLASLCRKSGRYEEAVALYGDAIRMARLEGRTGQAAFWELKSAATRARAWLARLGL